MNKTNYEEIHILCDKHLITKLSDVQVKKIIKNYCDTGDGDKILKMMGMASLADSINSLSREKYNVLISILGE